MIGQYFSQTNESATVPVLQNFLKLNNALQFGTKRVLAQAEETFSSVEVRRLSPTGPT